MLTPNRGIPLISEEEANKPQAVNDALLVVDAQLQAIIDTENAAVTETELSDAITGEVIARNNAITAAVGAEATARGTAIGSAITSEVTNRNSAIATATAGKVDATDYRLRGAPLTLNLSSFGSLLVLTDTQCRSQLIKLTGTLTANFTLEFLNLNLDWKIIDLTTRAGFTLSVRKTGGSSVLIPVPTTAGDYAEFYADGP
jgi:hypothetical protein